MGPTEQKHRVAFEVAENVWTRKSLDDLIFLVLVLVDTFTAFPVKSVQAVTSTDKTTLNEVYACCVSRRLYMCRSSYLMRALLVCSSTPCAASAVRR